MADLKNLEAKVLVEVDAYLKMTRLICLNFKCKFNSASAVDQEAYKEPSLCNQKVITIGAESPICAQFEEKA
jgi:hypothetical protein